MKHLFRKKSLTFLTIAAFLVGGFFVFAGGAAAVDGGSETVTTQEALKMALANDSVSEIIIGDSFDVTEKIIISRPVIINGNSKTITMSGNIPEKWNSPTAYIFQVYGTKDVTIKDIKLTHGNAALLINKGEATLLGNIDVSGNGFGGIESSHGSILTVSGVTFTNTTEAYGLPTLWEDGVTDTTIVDVVGTKNTTIKPTQIQYYLAEVNSTTKFISTSEQLIAAINSQSDGQIWNIKNGTYNTPRFDSIDKGGQTGWYFPITANNLTIIGESKDGVILTSDTASANGSWASQDHVSVWGDNVTIKNITIQPKVETNKAIEVMGKNFILDNVKFVQRENQTEEFAGSLYFNPLNSEKNIGTVLVENVLINDAWISARTDTVLAGELVLKNTIIDFRGSAYATISGFGAISKNDTIIKIADGSFFKVLIDSNQKNIPLNIIDRIPAGGTVEFSAGTYELTEQIQVTKPITIKGIGKVIITPAVSFVGASNPEKNLISINGVKGAVVIENLTFNKAKRSGINTWESTNVELKDIFSTNNVAGGLIVNNSAVTATNFNTSGNEWGYGINVDNGSNPSIGAPKTVLTFSSGTLSEAIQIVSDKSGDVQVIATGYFPHQIDGTTQTIWTNRTLTENYQFLGDTTTVSTSTSEILVGGSNTGTSTVNIPSDVTNATMNLSALSTSTATSTTATILGAININASTTLGLIGVSIPAGVQITADIPDWNGILNAPTVKENSTVTATPDNGKNATVSSVIEIGYGDVKLTFDKAVKIVFSGQAGKEIGYSRDGIFTKIDTICSANTQEAADLLIADGDCKINVGSDLVIWTKHFTKFATYTQATKPNNSGGGGGGGGASYCSNVTYGEWGVCENGNQYRTITKPSQYCSLTVKQQLDSSRPCATPATPAVPGISPANPATPANPVTRPEIKKQVLGETKYAEGTLLRGTNHRIYVVKGNALLYVSNLKELAKYRGPILKVSDDVINSFSQVSVLGAKKYANGTLIKAKGDVKIYVIKDGKKVHIRSLVELRQYKGKTLTVEASELNNY